MMPGLVLATCDRPLPSAPGAPEWVQLFPAGKMTGRDGRTFELADAAAVIQAFEVGGVDLPIDHEHQNDTPEARLSGPVPAAGWIKDLKADDTGLWGRVEWTATAAEMISRREYRYLSPSFLYHAETRAIGKLNGAGLVHNPNLYLAALAGQDASMPQDRIKPGSGPQQAAPGVSDLAALLGLTGKPTAMELLRAVLELLKSEGVPDASATMAQLSGAAPDPSRFVPVKAVQAMLAERNLERAEAAQSRAHDKVADAFRRGCLTGPMREWAVSLCRSDEASFDAFLQGAVPIVSPGGQPGTRPGLPPGAKAYNRHGSELAEAVCAQLGLAPGSLDDHG